MHKLFEKRWAWIIVLILISIVPFWYYHWFNIHEHHSGDLVLYYLPRVEHVKQSVLEYHQWFPLWTPYYFAGTSYIGKPNDPYMNPFLGPMIFLLPTTLGAIKISMVLGMLIAGIGMFFLVDFLLQNKYAALIAALIYMFNDFILVRIFYWGWIVFAYEYPFLPFILLFAFMMFKRKNPLFYALIVGLLLALMIFAGSGIIFLYATLILGFLFFFQLVFKPNKQQFFFLLLFGIIIVVVTFGLAAFKIMPVREYLAMSARNLSYEETSSRSLVVPMVFTEVIKLIGVVGFLLCVFALFTKWKNKNVLYLTVLMIFSVLISMRTPLQYLLWKFYPGWTGMRYADRNLVIYVFAGSILAAYGFVALSDYIKKRYPNDVKKVTYLGICIIVVLLINLFSFGPGLIRIGNEGKQYVFGNIQDMIDNNHIMQAIAEKHGIFRMHVLETRGIDWGTEFYTVPLHLEPLYSYETSWLTDYLNEYLAVAMQNPARFWGILNTKYVTSMAEQNISGFTFLEAYPPCTSCFPSIPELYKAFGPYLYENEEFIPRAILVNKSILLIGEPKDLNDKTGTKYLTYSLILHPHFNPKTTIVVLGKNSIGKYSLEELKQFSAIILMPSSYTQQDKETVLEYKAGGGVLLPDLTIDQTKVTNEDIEKLMERFENGSSLQDIPDNNVLTLNFDNKKIVTSASKQWLVVSEQYALYPGWKVSDEQGQPLTLYRANGVISAVYLTGQQELLFSYQLRSFTLGSFISLISLVAVLLILIIYGVIIFKKKEKSDDHEQPKPTTTE